MRILKQILVSLLLLFLFAPSIVRADEPEEGTPFDYCRQIPSDQRSECTTCIARGAENEYIFTAVGCVQVSGSGLASDLIKLLLGIAGGVSLISLLAAAFKFTISRGDTGQIKSAKELIIAATTGLFFLIFSVIILEFIGVQVLRIPGLGEGRSGGGSKKDPVSAVPHTVPPGGACSYTFQCATTRDTPQGLKYVMSQCVDGRCQDWFLLEPTCQFQPNPDEYCQQQTGYEDSVCYEYPAGLGNCTLIPGVEDLYKPIHSVPIGGSCHSSTECTTSLEKGGKSYYAGTACIEGKCQVTSLSATGCEAQSDPDRFCQQLTGSQYSYCYSGTGVSQCNVPPAIPEMVECTSTAACNETYHVESGFECVFPDGGYEYPSGVVVGHCKKL